MAAVLALASAGASIYGGISEMQAQNQHAKIQRQQADLANENAQANAAIHATEVRKFAAKNKLAYIANGVNFAGSALLVTDEALSTGQKEVDAMSRRGNAEASLGYQDAKVSQNQGRASFISGFGQAASTLSTAYSKGDFS